MSNSKQLPPNQPNPYELPADLSESYRKVEERFYGLLQEGKLEEAHQSWEQLYKLFLSRQKELGYRLHKGGIVHNLGIVALINNDIELAFKNFVLGFAEDVASQEQGFLAGEAEEAPGARNLKTFYGVGSELFGLVRKIVKTSLSEGKFNDPRRAFKNFLEAQIDEEPIKSRVKTLKENPFVIQKQYDINHIPGEWNKRVFVGGNYRDRVSTLFEIREAIKRNGFTPIMALEFKDEEPLIHDHSLLLLHNCKYAIFDVSKDSGYLMEVERTLDYRTVTLLVYENVPEFGVSAMMATFQKIKEFSNKEELNRLIDDFLQGKLL